jgi:hypothetical protein
MWSIMEECGSQVVVSGGKLMETGNAKVVCSNGETSEGADLYLFLRASRH